MLDLRDTPLGWAARHSPERIVKVGVLALRARLYLSDGAAPGIAPLPNLRVRVAGSAEVPFWHASSGLYGFLTVPSGEARIEIDDPSGRFQPQAVTAAVPDRRGLRADLEAGDPNPTGPPPTYVDVALRPATGLALAPATTALWGVVSAGGRPVPGALLSLATPRNGSADSVSSLSGADGRYRLVLPFEVPDRGVTPPQRDFERALTVRAPSASLAARYAQLGFLAGQPGNVFALAGAERDALLPLRNFQLRDADGVLHPQTTGGHNPPAPIRVGQDLRLDIELLPLP